MPALPTLVAPGLPAGAALDRPGAFDWWYADLVDGDGNGGVVVAAFGLPMIPLALADRRRTPARALPALAFSAYGRGRVAHWVFLQPDRATDAGPDRTFGDSKVSLHLADGRVAFAADLVGDSGRAPFRASVRIEGPVPSAGGGADPEHAWCLLSGHATGTLALEVEGRSLAFSGRGYVDRNAGAAPLADLGVARWHWGRLSAPDHTLVWYAATGTDGRTEGRLLRIGADGVATALPGPTVEGSARGRYLLAHPRTVCLDAVGVRVPLANPVEDGPFYLRFLLAVGDAVGVAEVVDQAAMDRSPLLPLVRMAVDRGAASSRWLPLLVGPPESRFRRWWAG